MSEELKAAQARIACLEGEIAKRDEELAACRVAVENCDLFRARIAELEDLVLSLQCKAIESDDLRAELAAIKAQEPVIDAPYGGILRIEAGNLPDSWVRINPCKLYAAPVSEAKAQGVVMPDVNAAAKALCNRHAMICGVDADDQWKEYSQDFIADAETVLANARLNAAPVQQGSVPDGWRELLEKVLLTEKEARQISPSTVAYWNNAVMACCAALAAAPAAPAADAPPESCRQRLAAEGKPYPRSSCAACGQFSPKWRECDAAIATHSAKGVV